MDNKDKSSHPESHHSFSFTVFSRLNGRTTLDKRPMRELSRKNRYGDSYRQNKLGQVTHYKYSHNDKSFSFGYDAAGQVDAINSSDGWSWTRVQQPNFDGWLVRNYFECWRVQGDDCEEVNVSEEGILAAGKNTSQMGLPFSPQ